MNISMNNNPRLSGEKMQHSVSMSKDDEVSLDEPRLTDVKMATRQPKDLQLTDSCGLLETSQSKHSTSNSGLKKMPTIQSIVVPSAAVEPTAYWSVPFIPQHYHLERSSIKTHKTSLETIVKQISSFLRKNSIKCFYRIERGRIDCFTDNMLKFVLQLWKDDDNNDNKITEINESSNHQDSSSSLACYIDDEESSFILEVQRRQGCSFEMKNIRKLLFRNIAEVCQTKTATATATLSGATTSNEFRYNVPLNFDKQYYSTFGSSNNDVLCQDQIICNIADAIRLCVRLLDSEYHCQNRLGMESLRNLTNSSSFVSMMDAKFTSQEILLGRVESKGGRLRNHIVEWILACLREDEEKQPIPAMAQYTYHAFIMRSLALQVLANVLEESYQVFNDRSSTHQSSFLMWKNVIRKLVKILEMAIYRPEDAASAARCLRSFSKVDGLLIPEEADLENVAIKAHRYGKVHHVLLEKECISLIFSLMNERIC